MKDWTKAALLFGCLILGLIVQYLVCLHIK